MQYRYVSLARQQKKKQSRSSTSSTPIHTQDTHAQSEPEPMRDVISTSPESNMKQHDSYSHNTTTTSIDDQAINSWISQDTEADPMEVLDPQLFQGALGQYGPHIPHGHDDLFTTMNPYHESDRSRTDLTSPNSSTSLFPFAMSCDTWMNLSPTASKALLSMNENQQRPGGPEGQATLTDVRGSATPSSSNGMPSGASSGERGKTVLTLENLDPETRSEVLDLLFRRKIITTIEIV